jgi:hypothetical protein
MPANNSAATKPFSCRAARPDQFISHDVPLSHQRLLAKPLRHLRNGNLLALDLQFHREGAMQ